MGSELIGCYSSVETPVPIPNTEVKHTCADGTAWETVWKSRSQPINSLPFFIPSHLLMINTTISIPIPHEILPAMFKYQNY